MNKILLTLIIGLYALTAQATTCPNPLTSSLKWGEIPKPWVLNPFSSPPQGSPQTIFKQAHILQARYGQGIVCTYQFPLGEYSIWQQVKVKLPAAGDYRWIATYMGFICNDSREICQFYTV